jgi:ankyrin repeat protein
MIAPNLAQVGRLTVGIFFCTLFCTILVVGQSPTPTPAPDEKGNTPLLLAVRDRNLSAAKVLVDQGSDVNARNNAGETPVTLAADSRNAQMLLMLLSKGGDLAAAVRHVVDADDEQTLRLVAGQYDIVMTDQMFDTAMRNRSFGIAKLGLGRGVDPEHALKAALDSNVEPLIEAAVQAGASGDPVLKFAFDRGDRTLARTALERYHASPDLGLSLAIEHRDTDFMRIALSQGANATLALSSAARGGDQMIVQTLLDANADPNAGVAAAAEGRHYDIVMLLVRRGGSPDPAMPIAVRAKAQELVASLLASGANGKVPDLMALAAANDDQRIMEMLLSAGADPTAGMLAAVENNGLDTVRFLLGRKADARAGILIAAASRRGSQEMVSLLLSNGANANAGLAGAVAGDQPAILDYLISKGADPKDPSLGLVATAAGSGFGRTVSRLLAAGAVAEPGMRPAVMGGHTDVVAILIKAGASTASPEYIVKACQTGDTGLAALLLTSGAPKDAVDGLGQPLAHIAALTWNADLVTTILGLGVDPNAKNRAGDTALHVVADDEASNGYPKFKKQGRKRLPVLSALIAGKANVNAANAKGEFVLKVADDDYVKDVLKAAGAAKDQKDLDKKNAKSASQKPTP